MAEPPSAGDVQEIKKLLPDITEVGGAGTLGFDNQFMVNGVSRIRFGYTEVSVALKMKLVSV
jgi:hypothetical protein